MQRELRQLLERKVAMGPGHGSGYYYDMNDDLRAGDLIAGGKRTRAHLVPGSAAAKKHMAKLRKMKGHGGDYINWNDAQYYQGGAGGVKRQAKNRARAAVRGYKNPIEEAEKKYYKEEKQKEWARTVGPEYASKLIKKANMINDALHETGMDTLGREYSTRYNTAINEVSGYGPYVRAAREVGMKPPSWTPGAAPGAFAERVPRAVARAAIAPRARVPVGADDAALLAEKAYIDDLIARLNARQGFY